MLSGFGLVVVAATKMFDAHIFQAAIREGVAGFALRTPRVIYACARFRRGTAIDLDTCLWARKGFGMRIWHVAQHAGGIKSNKTSNNSVKESGKRPTVAALLNNRLGPVLEIQPPKKRTAP